MVLRILLFVGCVRVQAEDCGADKRSEHRKRFPGWHKFL